MEALVREFIKESIEVKHRFLDEGIGLIAEAAIMITDSFKKQKKALIFGNGGSAADAQHLAAEFVNRFLFDRPALPGIALTTDTSVLTSISNDSDYKFIFSRQIEALGQRGDVAIGISTSGASPNVVEALKKAKEMGLSTIAFIGDKKGDAEKYSDVVIRVPSDSTPRIQEVHIMIGHIICQLVEETMFPKSCPE